MRGISSGGHWDGDNFDDKRKKEPKNAKGRQKKEKRHKRERERVKERQIATVVTQAGG